MPIIALLTDYGTRDAYAASLKGVILGLCPEARIVDITHEIEPFNVAQGAFVLWQAWRWFPEGTIFVAVVDPGVGSERRLLIAQFAGRHVFAPDNGLLAWVNAECGPGSIRVIESARYSLPDASATFHGRDILAVAAARLANGEAFDSFGPIAERIEALDIPTRAEADGSGWRGRVVHVDRFGTLVTNIHAEQIQGRGGSAVAWTVLVNGKSIGPVGRAFHEAEPGASITFVGSSGLLEISVNRGSAAERFGEPTKLEVRLCKA